jgi:acyl-CoA thioester hydrolase
MRHLAPTRDAPEEFPFAVELRARFYETDAMAVVHHAAYLGYLETARVEYLRAIGRPYHEIRETGVDFAVIGVQLSYRAPLRFDDVFRVHAGVAYARRSSFAVEYLVERGGDEVLRGFTLHAVLDQLDGRPRPVPLWLRDAASTST